MCEKNGLYAVSQSYIRLSDVTHLPVRCAFDSSIQIWWSSNRIVQVNNNNNIGQSSLFSPFLYISSQPRWYLWLLQNRSSSTRHFLNSIDSAMTQRDNDANRHITSDEKWVSNGSRVLFALFICRRQGQTPLNAGVARMMVSKHELWPMAKWIYEFILHGFPTRIHTLLLIQFSTIKGN